MKKTLVSALTTALVVGAASTTFAASNPFSDVPADHWAYDAVSQLAADGVIEGYGDSTFRGDRNITRYEMAQMVARAMAKSDVSAADKAMIDKLAAEFADELNNLGVRVANLERNADMVKWNGKLEYTYRHDKVKVDGNSNTTNSNVAVFRLEPSAEVNDHWHVNARIDGVYNLKADNDTTGGNDVDFRLKRAWAQGDYKNFSVRLGKFSMYGDEDINDTTMSGLDATFGNKNKVSGTIGGGRTAGAYTSNSVVVQANDKFGTNFDTTLSYDGDAANVFYAGIDYNRNENKGFFGGVRYFRYSNADSDYLALRSRNGASEKNNIWQGRLGYKFDRSSTLRAEYSRSDVDAVNSNDKRGYAIEFDYKGAQAENAKTWGAWLAYRNLGGLATPAATWDVIQTGFKGWEIGANYTFMKNIIGTVRYGDTKDIYNANIKNKQFFGRVEWLF